MGSQGGSGGGGGAGGKKEDESAKHMFDRIGEKVYKEVKTEAENYVGDLKGSLSQASILGVELKYTDDPCLLIKDKGDELLGGNSKRYPCEKRSPVRFSDESRSQCTYNRIKDSELNNNDVGACAPFRRLSVCDYNLEKMGTKKNKARHNLLAEVCMAAKYEAQSLEKYRAQYEAKYGHVGFTICTVLARSFADIGDIVRGKDLYLGDKKEKLDLEKKLKKIFAKIYENLTDEVKKQYEGDKENYYQLREDWWTANRETVWKAITCDAPHDAQYFRGTCVGDGEHSTLAKKQCRCDGAKGANVVPTYFDYVPQYLRWFEEWAEDFCRKRKHKLKDAIDKCRGENGKERYCSRNGYDCTQTIRGIDKLVPDPECTNCSLVCTPFVDWIENKQKEFEKQKKKYDKEIQKKDDKTTTTITIGDKTINNWYVKEFYQQLQSSYKDVKDFLELLNKETTCKEQPYDDGEERCINFNEDTEKTFSHTEYCDTCPWCATKVKKEGKWTNEQYKSGCTKNVITTHDEKKTTEIKLLLKDKDGKTMVEKLGSLCNKSTKENIQKWKCHYEKKTQYEDGPDKDYCVLQDGKENRKDQTIRPYETFFSLWIDEMLKDSIEWSKELDNCLKNEKESNCIRECKKKCDCFKNWVKHMQIEWNSIKHHFDQQEGMDGILRNITLKGVLEILFKEKIEKAYGKGKWDELMQELNKIDKSQVIGNTEHSNDVIKILLSDEEKEAQKCTSTHNEENCKPKPQQESVLRSAGSPDTQSPPAGGPTEDSEEEEDEDDEDDEDNDVDKNVEAAKTEDDNVEKVCDTVKKALEGNLDDACKLKYGKTAPTSWKCISDTATGKDGATGGLCIPPRRRRLYVGKLEEWAKEQSQSQETSDTTSPSDNKTPSEAQTQSSSNTTLNAASTSTSQTSLLRDAFIQSAAVETFFLWHRYKKIKLKEKLEEQARQNGGLALSHNQEASQEDDPQSKLQQTGEIPTPFLRQMFYTLGDYRDILVGDISIVQGAISDTADKNGKQIIQDIEQKIQQILSQNGDTPATKPSDEKRKKWWQQHAESIWNGMICALTHKTEKPGDVDEDVKGQLFESGKNEPKKSEYKYDQVKLEENSGAKPTEAPTLLTNFISRPPYFRYLEEWGETFCRERKKRLEEIYKDCRGGENRNRHSSGDGEDCETVLGDDSTTFKDLEYRTCAKHCRWYKKWIDIKKKEFDKQKSAYEQQKTDATRNNDYSGFHTTLNTYSKAGDFLEKLKNGPCKNDSAEGNGKDILDFDKPDETFRPAENCKPCSQFKVKCNGSGKCIGGGTKVNCNGGTITTENFNTMGNFTHDVDMLVSDNSTNGVEGDLKAACGSANIFQGIKENKWSCRNVCGYVVCKSEQGNENENKSQILLFNALLKRWVEYFLEDYKKIKHKISHCTNNKNTSTCITGCKDKCSCVQKWVSTKKDEWEKIKKHYLEQYKDKDSYPVKSFLEPLLTQIAAANDKREQTSLDNLKASIGCNCIENSKQENGKESDIIDCMLEKLGEKAKKCQNQNKNQASVETQDQHSDHTQTACVDSTHVGDHEEPLEETEENTVEQPNICPPQTQPQPQPEDESDCKPAAAPPSSEEKPNPEDTPVPKPAKPAPKQEKRRRSSTPRVKPPQPDLSPLKTALMSSTIMWSIGIGFAAFTYFYLKKKRKKKYKNKFIKIKKKKKKRERF